MGSCSEKKRGQWAPTSVQLQGQDQDGTPRLTPSKRTQAASPQIASLNPLVSLTALPTLAPFVLEGSPSDGKANGDKEMVEFLKREKVDVLVACDLGIVQNVSQLSHDLDAQLTLVQEAIDAAARAAGTMFYASSTYGFYGYVFADLGETYDYVYMSAFTWNTSC